MTYVFKKATFLKTGAYIYLKYRKDRTRALIADWSKTHVLSEYKT